MSSILHDRKYPYPVLEVTFCRNVVRCFFNIYPDNLSQYYSFLLSGCILSASDALLLLPGISLPPRRPLDTLFGAAPFILLINTTL